MQRFEYSYPRKFEMGKHYTNSTQITCSFTRDYKKTISCGLKEISEEGQRKLCTLELDRKKLMNLAHNHTITRKEEILNRELELINVKRTF